MKTKIFLFIVLAVGFVNAQQARFGLKVGLNISTISGFSNADIVPGFNVGGLLEIKINERIAIQPEILYSTQGTEFKSLSVKQELNYVNIPVMFKYFLINGLCLEAGPQAGVLIAATPTGDPKNISGLYTKDNSNNIDFSVLGGLGYYITDHINLGVRYNFGLTKVNKTNPNLDIRNNVFQVGAAYRF